MDYRLKKSPLSATLICRKIPFLCKSDEEYDPDHLSRTLKSIYKKDEFSVNTVSPAQSCQRSYLQPQPIPDTYGEDRHFSPT